MYESLGRRAWLGIVAGVLGVELAALVAGGVLVALGQLDWWYLMLAAGAFGVQVLAFRADWGVGLGILGFIAAVAGALLLVVHNTGFSGAPVQISFALLAVVSLLSAEWLTRKLVRLA